ncbi:hypothetical protein CDV31_012048 [Fusarium ambrosium]|uniref:CENP-V/GFA domain-containing protein n=1 Tax=Fusarium ambrosium TaxID=131363 RepID=A0A428TCR1_9HYPO|nr:hypothetical protein CDV31_012048 [Fusarium ambrosium]
MPPLPVPQPPETEYEYEPYYSDAASDSYTESYTEGRDEETASETDEPFPPPEYPPNTAPWRYPPTSWELELEGLAHTLPLKADREDEIDTTSESKEWLAPKRDVDASCSTERLDVNALEYSVDQDRVALVCPEGPQTRVVDPRSIQLRWLFGNSTCIRPGSIRCIGSYPPSDGGPPKKTKPVIFVSSQYLNLQPVEAHHKHDLGQLPQPLLRCLYGYDVDAGRENDQAVRKMSISSKEVLHVGQLWCLLVGPGILITMSQHSIDELRGQHITLERGAKPLTIRLIDEDGSVCQFVVQRDCSYVELLGRAVFRAKRPGADARGYDLLDRNRHILNAKKWLQISASTTINHYVVHLKTKIVSNPGYAYPGYPMLTSQTGNMSSTMPYIFPPRQYGSHHSMVPNGMLVLPRFPNHSPAPKQKDKSKRATPTTSTSNTESGHIHWIPFFSWLPEGEASGQTPEAGDKHLFKTLDQVEKALSSSQRASYLEAFQCTFQDLLHRHELHLPASASLKPNPLVNQANENGEKTSKSNSPISQADRPTIKVTNEPKAGPSPTSSDSGPRGKVPGFSNYLSPTVEEASMTSRDSDDLSDSSRPPSRRSKMKRAFSSKSESKRKEQIPDHQTTGRCEELKQKVLEASLKILASFVPDGVDAIFRQISWAYVGNTGMAYMIRNFDALSSLSDEATTLGPREETWADCPYCRSERVYGSAAEALQHLHSYHSQRVTCGSENVWPFDDPSFVWLYPTTHGGQDRTNVERVEDAVNKFIHDLLELHSTVEELHLLAARAFKTDKMEKTPPHSQKLRALFGELASFYILKGSHLSLLNRLSLPTTGKDASGELERISRQTTEIELEESRRLDLAKNLSEGTKSDIIVLTNTTATAGGLGAEAVGAEFLVLALMLNLQSRPLKIPKKVKDGKANRSDGEMEVVETYQNYVAKLHIQANRRPQKRLFLDINAVQEEIDALLVMGNCQWVVVNNFMRLIWPWSFHVPEPTRMDLHLIEDRYARSHMNKRASVDSDLLTLREKTTALKENVKQIVEVLEENHGKAIRVFTIVTLFFLPLSFVSSFMGMNTMDIRDMEHNQTIYWTAAVPVTVGTMALALMLSATVLPAPKSFDTEHETGMTITLHFCPDCGTTMWKEASAPQFKGVKIVQAGTLTDPTNFTGKIDVELYAPERASWLAAVEGATQKEQL